MYFCHPIWRNEEMILPSEHIQNSVDRLAHGSRGFALYRLPWTDECHFVLQTSDEVDQLARIRDLNRKKGFVMAPFRQSGEHPLVVIRPDITARGWDEIGKALSLPDCEESIWACPLKRKKSFPPLSEEACKQHYMAAFELFIAPLREKRFQKLVLSRAVTHPLSEDFSPLEAFIRACNSYPRMMIYLCHTPVSGTWMGSTPEILLSGHGREWHTVALAGTLEIENGVLPAEWDSKNKEEQEYVANYIRHIVSKFGDEMMEKGPYTARAGQIVHLKTDFRFQMKDTDRPGNLLQELHPTPAVCGLPKEEAFRFIPDHEGYDRGYYSGFIGWLDPEGHTDLYVNLRCMEIVSGGATLYAGGGILALSEMESEWKETGEKMKTMSLIINRY